MNTSLPKELNLLLKKATLTAFLKGFSLMLFALLSFSTHAQVSTYTYSELNGPVYADLQSNIKTQLFTGAWNSGVPLAPVSTPIGFNFTFNATSYSNVTVAPNGYVTFGATMPTAGNQNPIASLETYTGAISGFSAFNNTINVTSTFMDPLYPAFQANSVSKLLTGTAPNRILKIEYRLFYRAIGNTTNMSMQIWLHETTNVVEIHYAPTIANFVGNLYGQIGLRGAINTDATTRLYGTSAWPTLPAVTTAGTAGNYMFTRNGTGIATTANRLFRWTPSNCNAPNTPSYTNLLSTSVNLTWGVPSPVPGSYNYEVRSSGAAGSGPAGLASSGTVATSPATATGLVPGTTYTAYVRSDCGGSQSAWVACGTFTTLCAAVNVPYAKYIDPVTEGFTVPGIPACMTTQNAGTGNNWVSRTPALPVPAVGSFFDEFLVYNFHPINTANAWVYTQGINLTAGQTYRLSYTYGGSSQFTFITNKMKVMYGNVPQAANMTTLMDDHPVIKTSALTNVVNFTAPSSGVFYFGFNAYSTPNNGELYLDDIEIFVSSCRQPTAVTIPPAFVTFNSALVTWTAPSPAPSNGYAYYLSTSNTPPTNSTAPTGTLPAGTTITTLNGLTPSTTYYFWVRGNCGGEFSEWSTISSFTTAVAPPVYCIPVGSSVDGQGITNVTMGSINNTTGSEAGTAYYGDYSGLTTNVSQGATVPVAITFNTSIFDYNTHIWVDWNNNGSFLDAGELVYNGLSSSTSPNTLNASFVVPGAQPLGSRRLRIGGTDFGPFTDPCRAGTYQSYEDYTINVVVAPPLLTLNMATSTQCGNTNSPLVTITSLPLSNFDVYSWSPSLGVTGTPATGYTFNTGTSTTYILTASQTSGSYSTNTAVYRYVANDTPTPITIATPSGTVACQSGPGIPLNASGGVVSNITIFNEDFNSGFGGFTTTFGSTGGATPLNSALTLRPNGYNTGGPSWFQTINSNDNSQFVLTNSDSQGSGTASTTRVTLVSPPIPLPSGPGGYTAASLSFWHYYRYWPGGAAPDATIVQITTDAGATWSNLVQYTNTQGTATNFAQAIINLNPYIGQTIQIRFNYQAYWGWGWAIDNFKVSGSTNSSITWTPVAGLFNDAAGLSPYVLNTGANTVYAIPTSATTYTASASTPGPTVCNATQTVSVTVTPVVAGTVAPLSQTYCNTSDFMNFTLSGQVGNIIRWEYANDAAFTLGVTAIANTTTTLTPAQFGVFPSIRYFRAVVGTGTCNNLFTPAVFASLPTTTYTGTWDNGTPDATKKVIYNFAGSLNIAVNMSACSVQIINGNVNVNPGIAMTVNGAVNVGGGSLTFQNNASLIQVSNVANTGNITYIRDAKPMFKYDYTYWSSPVAAQNIRVFSPNTLVDKYFYFNTGVGIYNWTSIYANGFAGPYNTNMTPGIGYIIRAPDAGLPVFDLSTRQVFVGTFFGVPNNGNITAPIVTTGALRNNFIGNPYPSAISASLFLSDVGNDPVVDGTIYLWTHNTPITAMAYNPSDFATYNYSGGVGTGVASPGFNNSVPNGNIAAGQGFFIEGSVASGTVTFRNTMRTAVNNQFYRLNSPNPASALTGESHRFWLQISNDNNVFKQALIGYFANATNDYDRGFDGKLLNQNSLVNIYSILGDKKLSIQGRGLPFSVQDEIPLGYGTQYAGTLTIDKMEQDGLFSDQAVYLEDKMLNTIHNLSESAYSFVSSAGTFENRFVIRFTNSLLGIADNEFTDNAVIVYKKNQNITIETSNFTMESVKIFDIRGRLIKVKNNINATETTFENMNLSEQVLLIHITDTNGRIVTKKLVF